MNRRSTGIRATGVLTWRVIPWLAGIPAASACSFSNISSCLSSPPTTVIVVAAVIGSLVILSIILAVSCRVRRLRKVEHARLARRPSIPQLPLPMVYQAPTQPRPRPQPQGHRDGYGNWQSDSHRHPQSRGSSYYGRMSHPTPMSMPIPEPISTAPAVPAPSVRVRPPSGVPVSRPISSPDTRPFSIRSSTYAYDPEHITLSPLSSPVRDPTALVPPQPTVVRRESTEAIPPTSPSGTTSPVVNSPIPASPRLSSHTDTPLSPPTRPFALAPVHTGTSIANNDDPPPAYTPI